MQAGYRAEVEIRMKAVLRAVVGEGPTSVCGRGGGQAGPRGFEYIAKLFELTRKQLGKG